MAQNLIDRTFRQLRARKKKALVAYLAAGYPAFAEQEKIIRTLVENGVDILELGIPFSDPIADGPTIQFASQQSLNRGTTLKKILEWTSRLRRNVSIPIVYMSYLNPIMAYGLDRFSRDAARAGVQGLIVPDLIPEEAREVRKALEKNGLYLIHLVAPTTPPARQRKIAALSKGFLYAVSVRGVTGARTELPAETKNWLARLRKSSRAPLCVGFGISGPKQVKALKSAVDGFIVGSALIEQVRRNARTQRINKIKRFVADLNKECSNGRSS
jgi:tryptophan synthase alpha chain